jgi:peroxiredoxin (alkyl hydroperoxide reductase subunit C)
MAILAAGTPAPEFALTAEDGSALTQQDVAAGTHVFAFYPAAFSSVCTDQFQIYQEALDEIRAAGAEIYGVSCDQRESQTAFRKQLGVQIPQLSDFEPKGATSRAFGAYFAPTGVSNRALVVIRDGVVAWSWEGEHPGVLPGVNLLFDGLQAANTGA